MEPKIDEQGFDRDGKLHAIPPQVVEPDKEGARLNKLEQERMQRAEQEKPAQPGQSQQQTETPAKEKSSSKKTTSKKG